MEQTNEDKTIKTNLVLDPSRPLVEGGAPPRHLTGGAPPRHQTDGVAFARQTGGVTSDDLDPSRALVAASRQPGGVAQSDHDGITLDPSRPLVEASFQLDGAPPRHLTSGAPAHHQTDDVALAHQNVGDQVDKVKRLIPLGSEVDPSRPLVEVSVQRGGAPPSHQTGGAPPRHQTDGVASAHQNVGETSGAQAGDQIEEYKTPVRTLGVDVDPSRPLVEVPVQLVGAQPRHQTGGVADDVSHRSTYGIDAAHQTHGVQETSNQGSQGSHGRRMIQKVPTYIRQKYNSEDYDPLVASFGPYNYELHNAPDQRLALVEDFKAKALEWFVQGTGNDANHWFRKFWFSVPIFRTYYTQESTEKYSNAQLTRTMLQDASLAILIMGVANQEQQEIELLYSHLGAATVATIIRDSFLLENQLPFALIRDMLHEKFGLFKGEARWKKHFIISCHGSRARKDTTVYWDEEAGDPGDFVEALKIAHLSGWKRENIDKGANAINRDENKEDEKISLFKDYYAVHSVTELKSKGITVQPNSTNSFKNITFESNCFSGTLKFPVDFVNYATKAAYSNIIAYEMSEANETQDYTMTAYVHLMKSLLQSPKDVEELQANGIIINMLGSNEQVMNLYRDIYTFGTNCSSKYSTICQKMEEHYNNKTKTWLAEFLYTYFRNPWTVIALFGSILVVALTFIQTYYAINQ